MATKGFLSLNAMDKLMREAGAHRVGDDAKVALAQVLEEKGLEIARGAQKFAEHAGRRTIVAKDIQLAVNNQYNQ